jgi:hypothetical protein
MEDIRLAELPSLHQPWRHLTRDSIGRLRQRALGRCTVTLHCCAERSREPKPHIAVTSECGSDELLSPRCPSHLFCVVAEPTVTEGEVGGGARTSEVVAKADGHFLGKERILEPMCVSTLRAVDC